jgi:hypothetical protein
MLPSVYRLCSLEIPFRSTGLQAGVAVSYHEAIERTQFKSQFFDLSDLDSPSQQLKQVCVLPSGGPRDFSGG